MIPILPNSVATENSGLLDLGMAVEGKLILEVVDEDAWSGVLKVAGRVTGRGAAGEAAYGTNLPLVDLSDSTAVAAATGITAAGLYSVDISGLEVRIEHTFTSGEVSVYGEIVTG